MFGIIQRDFVSFEKLDASVSVAEAVVFSMPNLGRYENLELTIRNDSATLALTACKVQSAPVDVDNMYTDEDTTTFATLGANTVLKKRFTGNAQPFWRIKATGAGDLKLDLYVRGN